MRVFRQDMIENFSMALSMLRAHKLRSFLTVIGVVIGVWTVMAVASIISGIDFVVKKEVESFGTNSIHLHKFQSFNTGRLTREERMRKDLTYEDAKAIAELPSIEMAVPFLNISNDFEGRKILVSSEGVTSAAVRLEGTLPDYMNTGQEFLADGRFFTDYENETSQKVAVLRGAVAEHFFPYTSPVGKSIQIDGDDFRIVGALTMRTFLFQGSGSNDLNNGIFIPFKEARKIKPSATDVFILAVARPGRLEEAKDQVVDLLRRRRGVHYGEPDNFGLATADSVIENFRSITFGIAVSMITISSIGLIVGGIGVMNIMLMSVKERTREIGVRRALGARRRDILSQFLVEAVTLTGIGGLIGLGLGWISSFLIKIFVPSYVPLWAPLVGFLVSVSIGLVSGLWPAWKAARLNPVESLRYE